MNTMHETYPGHHVQFIRAAIDPTPETVKIGAKSVPLEEGTCIRTERAFTFIFAEDPFFPLFVAFRRHHASVRILVDLQLYYFGATLEDAVKIYEEELGLSLIHIFYIWFIHTGISVSAIDAHEKSFCFPDFYNYCLFYTGNTFYCF